MQESLANALRHSGASQIAVTMGSDDRCLHICITDNGTGFDPQRVHPGKSVTSMEKRARGIGAALHIDGVGGTAVRVTLPLGLGPWISSPEGLARYQAAEITQWAQGVKEPGAKAD